MIFDSKACDICIGSKQTRDSYPLSSNKTSFAFELIHCDLWGLYRTTSICGSRYFFTIVDEFSRAVWIYLIRSKDYAPTHLKNFLGLVARQFARQKQFKEIMARNLYVSDFSEQQGIIHKTYCVGKPQQNGRVERNHHHIFNVARALRFQACLPIEF